MDVKRTISFPSLSMIFSAWNFKCVSYSWIHPHRIIEN